MIQAPDEVEELAQATVADPVEMLARERVRQRAAEPPSLDQAIQSLPADLAARGARGLVGGVGTYLGAAKEIEDAGADAAESILTKFGMDPGKAASFARGLKVVRDSMAPGDVLAAKAGGALKGAAEAIPTIPSAEEVVPGGKAMGKTAEMVGGAAPLVAAGVMTGGTIVPALIGGEMAAASMHEEATAAGRPPGERATATAAAGTVGALATFVGLLGPIAAVNRPAAVALGKSLVATIGLSAGGGYLAGTAQGTLTEAVRDLSLRDEAFHKTAMDWVREWGDQSLKEGVPMMAVAAILHGVVEATKIKAEAKAGEPTPAVTEPAREPQTSPDLTAALADQAKGGAVEEAGAAIAPTVAETAAPVPVEPRQSPGKVPPPEKNYAQDLGDYATTLHRESSIGEAVRMFEPLPVSSDTTQDRPFFSNNPDLALGQGANRGVKMEFDAKGIQGQINQSKPTWAQQWDQGNAEFVGSYNDQNTYRRALRKITFSPEAMSSDKALGLLVKRSVARIEQGGEWSVTKGDDGSITFERKLENAAAVPQKLGEADVGQATPVTSSPEAAAPEPETSPDATSIKDETVAREMESMGFEKPTPQVAHTFREVWESAKAEFADDPFIGKRLVETLSREMRPPTRREDALLAFENRRLVNERRAAQDAYNVEQTPENLARVEQARADYAKAAQIFETAGGESSGSLGFRKMMLKQDYSLAEMERAATVANKGKALNETQSAEIEGLYKQIDAAQKALEDYKTTAEKRIGELELRKVVEQAEKKLARRPRAAHVQEFLSEQAAKARERIAERAKTVQLHAGGITTQEIIDYAIIGADHIARGAAKFADWSREMLADLGESIQPHLAAIYAKSNEINEGASKEAGRLKGYKTRAQKTIDTLTGRMASEDFSKPPAREPIPLDSEAIRLQAEVERVKRDYKRALNRYERANRSKVEKVAGSIGDALGLTKSLKAAFDFSAVLRQGALFTAAHPIQTLTDHIPKMIRAARTEQGALEIDVALRNRPMANFAERAGLVLSELGDNLGPHEEQVFSRWANQIPGLKGSNRAFTTFINVQRAAAFDAMVRGIDHPTLDQAKEIARFVNIGTGRGDFGRFSGALDAAGKVLWAPRLMASRFQMLAEPARQGVRFATGKGDAPTAKSFANEYARALGSLAAVYAIAQIAGATVGTDPNSSDFGKIKVGNTRIDPLAGLSQMTVLMSRVASGERTNAAGKSEPASIQDSVSNFLRGKLTPVLGTAIDLKEGHNMVGEPVTPASALGDAVTPLSFRDIYEAMKEHGIPAGTALGILATFGAGLQTYEPKKKPLQSRPSRALTSH